MIVVLSFIAYNVSAFDTNFSFYPASWTQFKLYCDAPIYMMIDWWPETYNWFETSILFDSDYIQVKTWLIYSPFQQRTNSVIGNMYRVWWSIGWTWYKEWLFTWVSFNIITKDNTGSTSLYFVDKNWNPHFIYWTWTTSDGISLAGYDHSPYDILSNVINVTYNFVALPCVLDNKQPIIGDLVKFWTYQSVNNKNKIASDQILSFETYDRDDWNKVNYWFSGNDAWNLSNYVTAPNNVDNQEWVNSSSISVTVSCPTCSDSPSNVGAELNISDWNWTTSMNALTWDSERRWYYVSFDAPFPYEVEKKVTVNISVADNPNEFWVTHTWTRSFSFNSPVAPTIVRNYPSSIGAFVSPSKNFPIIFTISDDWAGVDTGSVRISVQQIMSGNEVLLPWYVYSWSDLHFELISWTEWLWNSWSYIVSFDPKEDFPVSSEITMYVTWSDLAWKSKTIISRFTTRPSCDFFWCVDNLNVILSGISNIFTWKVLSITWTNPDSPYPYFTWENDEILMCGWNWTWINFAGNITIYDTEWNLVWDDLYTNNELFITWLDFVYEDWKIIVQ